MPIKLIIGLGNPGEQFTNTRHNIGFKFINAILKHYDVPKKVSLKSHLYQINVKNESILLIKPQTFMNLSGQATQAVMHYYKIEPSEICVVTDDLDVAFGRVRIRQKGGAGTHNGMKSMIQTMGTLDFLRIRLGIGPKAEYMDAKDYVLQNFSQDEQSRIPHMLDQLVGDFLDYIDQPIDMIMNRLNPKEY